MASRVMKVGVSRVKISSEKEVEEAITRNDVKKLIKKGLIYKIRKKGITRADANFKRKQKKKGRRKGEGRRKGAYYSKKTRKRIWVDKVRPLRRLLRQLRDNEELKKGNYRKLYLMIRGGAFRNKKHLLYYLKEHELLKTAGKAAGTKNSSRIKTSKTKKKKPVKKTGKKAGTKVRDNEKK